MKRAHPGPRSGPFGEERSEAPNLVRSEAQDSAPKGRPWLGEAEPCRGQGGGLTAGLDRG